MRLTALAAALAAAGTLAAQTSLDSLAHFDVQPLGSYSAIWGYTAPDGREYALLGVVGGGNHPGGTSIIDITNTDALYEAAFIPGPISSWREMKTYGHYAYVVTEAGGGVQIIDLSGLPDTAWLVTSFNFTSGSNSISRSHTISIHDGFMYLNGCGQWSPGGIVIFDLHPDPVAPVFVGEYQPDYIHDAYVRNDTIFGSAVYGGGGLYIADARDKAHVQTVGKISYSGSGTHNAWVTKDRRFAVTTDEIGSTAKSLKIWDISQLPSLPTSPTAAFGPLPGQIEHNITIRGDYAYVAWYSAGVRVVDLADPELPVDAGNFDTSPTTSGYNGVWGIYPFFPSGKIIAGDMQNGLWVFRFTGLPPREPVHLLEPADGDTVGGPVAPVLRWSHPAPSSADPHTFLVHLRGGSVDDTLATADSTIDLAGGAGLQAGETYRWSVITKDEWNMTASADTFSFVYGLQTGVGESPAVPLAFGLLQNYPNPFNGETQIAYSVPGRGGSVPVSLVVVDMLGRTIATIVDGMQPPGDHRVGFVASSLPSGVYLYRLRAGGREATRKMILLR
jgi:choice-of-anchor B domain-containing protein